MGRGRFLVVGCLTMGLVLLPAGGAGAGTPGSIVGVNAVFSSVRGCVATDIGVGADRATQISPLPPITEVFASYVEWDACNPNCQGDEWPRECFFEVETGYVNAPASAFTIDRSMSRAHVVLANVDLHDRYGAVPHTVDIDMTWHATGSVTAFTSRYISPPDLLEVERFRTRPASATGSVTPLVSGTATHATLSLHTYFEVNKTA